MDGYKSPEQPEEEKELGFIVVSKKTYRNGTRHDFKIHEDYDAALEEATRLCQLERAEFIIYQPVALVEMKDVKVTEF